MIKIDDIEIEDVDDSWYWQITQRKKYLPQQCLPRNRFG